MEAVNCYMVKGNREDAVTKDEFMKFFTYQDHHQLREFSFKQILKFLKKNEYQYDSNKRIRGNKGAFLCIKFNEVATELDWFSTIVPGYLPIHLDAGKFFLYCQQCCTAGFMCVCVYVCMCVCVYL